MPGANNAETTGEPGLPPAGLRRVFVSDSSHSKAADLGTAQARPGRKLMMAQHAQPSRMWGRLRSADSGEYLRSAAPLTCAAAVVAAQLVPVFGAAGGAVLEDDVDGALLGQL